MSPPYLIIGNWKANGTLKGLNDWFATLSDHLKQAEAENLPIAAKLNKGECKVVLMPPFTLLSAAKDLAKQLKHQPVVIGSQDVSSFSVGAHTGEIPTESLSDVGCEYSLVGHSERRTHLGEGEDTFSKKLTNLTQFGIEGIYCIGENADQKQKNATKSVIEKQLLALSAADLSKKSTCLIAYEPVWAIGSGQAATPTVIRDVMQVIHNQCASDYSEVATLYGGSVSASNAGELGEVDLINGLLVGGASLKATEFWDIITAFMAQK